MNPEQLEKAKAQVRALFAKKREQLDIEEQDALHSLDVLERLAPEIDFGPSRNGNKKKRVMLKDAVWDVLADVPELFTINEVIPVLPKKYPGRFAAPNPTSVSGVLRGLCDEEQKIWRKKKGKGQAPTVYSKVPCVEEVDLSDLTNPTKQEENVSAA